MTDMEGERPWGTPEGQRAQYRDVHSLKEKVQKLEVSETLASSRAADRDGGSLGREPRGRRPVRCVRLLSDIGTIRSGIGWALSSAGLSWSPAPSKWFGTLTVSEALGLICAAMHSLKQICSEIIGETAPAYPVHRKHL